MHFFVHVMFRKDQLPKKPTAEDFKAAAGRVLAPFSEDLDVPEHKVECWCVGQHARREASEIADRQVATIDSLRESFATKHPLPAGKSYFELPQDATEERDALWRNHISLRVSAEAAALAAHPLRETADATCDECKGSGERLTTANPNGKWDWWCVGGRWSGILGGIDVTKNPANFEPCFVCRGTGYRSDEIGRSARLLNPDYKCNGCQGEGKTLKFASDLVNEGNVAVVSEVLADLKERAPFAIITPDGEWRQRGEMGMFGCASNEQPAASWRDDVRALYELNLDAVLVAVDCHV